MLKFYITILSFCMVFRVLAQDPPAVHGMVVMGTQQIYASHLPMFHSPHDYQVILEISFSPKNAEIYRKAYEESTTKFFTLEPEEFILPQMIHKPTIFRANLYEGHFERGGKKIMESIEVKIKQVIYSKKLNEKLGLKNLHFLVFGNEKEQFAVHLITIRPDFDQIFRLKCPLKELPPNKLHYWDMLIPDTPNAAFKKDKTKAVYKTKWIDFSEMQQIYLEFGDLE